MSFLGCGVGYFTFGWSKSLILIVLARTLLGVLKHCQTLSQSCIADMYDNQSDRQVAFARIRTSFGVAFILGPSLSGILLSWNFGFKGSATVALLVYLLAFFLVLYFLDDDSNEKEKVEKPKNEEKTGNPFFNQMKLVGGLLTRKHVGSLLIIKFLFHLAIVCGREQFGEFMNQLYGLEASYVAYLFSYMGLITTISSFLLKYVDNLFSNKQNYILYLGLTLVLSYASQAIRTSIPIFMFIMFIRSLCHVCLSTLILTVFTSSLGDKQRGLGSGIGSTFNSIGEIFAPTVCGLIIKMFGITFPQVFSALLVAISLSIFYKEYKFEHSKEKEE